MARSLDLAGFAPDEAPAAEIVDMGAGKLKIYGRASRHPAALLVPAPIKRSYVWDISPDASPLRRLQENGVSVFVLDWPDAGGGGMGPLAVDLLARAVAAVAERTGHPPALIGHSLGGTLAAVYAARRPRTVSALGLVDAALAFDDRSGPLPRAMRAFPPPAPSGDGSYPGALMSVQGAMSIPHEFIFGRMLDAMASAGDRRAAALHWRVVRWSLDEYAMPAALFRDAIRLIREDAFSTGRLEVAGKRVGPDAIAAPILAVVDPLSLVAPPRSILGPLRRAGNPPARVLRYRGDLGAAFRHLGPLVGPSAQREIWPRVAEWLAQSPRDL